MTGRTEAALVEGIEALCGVLWVSACDDLQTSCIHASEFMARQLDVDVDEQLMKVVRKAPLSRLLAFAPLLYQLSSRLASHGNNFQKTLEALLLQLAKAAPAKTILQIIALANGSRVDAGKGSTAFAKNVEGSERVRENSRWIEK